MKLYDNLEYQIKWTLNADKLLHLGATIYDKSNNKLGTIKNEYADGVFPETSQIMLSDSKERPILVSTNSVIYDVSNMDDKIPLGIVTEKILSFSDQKDLKSLNKHEIFLIYKSTGGGCEITDKNKNKIIHMTSQEKMLSSFWSFKGYQVTLNLEILDNDFDKRMIFGLLLHGIADYHSKLGMLPA